jgi:membrane protease YdiL (CAAX protease family)
MTIIIPIFIVFSATIGIFQLRALTSKTKFAVHTNPLIDGAIKFQSVQVVLAFAVLVIVYLLNPENFKTFFQFGDIQARISKITWLGITGNETWLEIVLVLGLFITLGTGIFMYSQAKKAGAQLTSILVYIPWVILFSAMNAFSEEAIFRIGIVAPLYGQLPVWIILLISGTMFGLPHYFGQPSGIIGVLMAGFLGWLLAMSLMETQGLFLAWAVHFVQDVVIITTMFLMGNKS